MPKHTCATCPYFNLYGADAQPAGPIAGMEGDCRKEPPKLSSIGVPSHPRITSDWVACGAHPDVMFDAFIPMGAKLGDEIVNVYEAILPRIVKMALDAGEQMEKAGEK